MLTTPALSTVGRLQDAAGGIDDPTRSRAREVDVGTEAGSRHARQGVTTPATTAIAGHPYRVADSVEVPSREDVATAGGRTTDVGKASAWTGGGGLHLPADATVDGLENGAISRVVSAAEPADFRRGEAGSGEVGGHLPDDGCLPPGLPPIASLQKAASTGR